MTFPAGLSPKKSPDDRLPTAKVAALAGVTVGSVREYRRRGTIPEPDGRLGSTPWWFRSTIEQWIATPAWPGSPSLLSH